MELQSEDISAVILRMKRAHGHLASVISMLETGVDDESALTQLAAVNKAISRSGYALVFHALHVRSGDPVVDTDELKRIEKLFLSLA
ncbi:metal-sensitive transcriptional regulator [Nocardioides acrostichi]|uniref:Metal-sensing transcriptional repressor n=1 Tax=Nocardioides acrostichi TaxID=2784339 RepID=A0A930UZ50_9ACTN|nr:metal-sensing transcriptional repressor [Nocardioides acrostichi]MBF4162402.1 metal-sensing transcriptional repressor [Nocardioides acrostichi]